MFYKLDFMTHVRIPNKKVLGSLLVGGFNAFEKYKSNWIILPGRGENKNIWKPPPRKSPWKFEFGIANCSSSNFEVHIVSWIRPHICGAVLTEIYIGGKDRQQQRQKMSIYTYIQIWIYSFIKCYEHLKKKCILRLETCTNKKSNTIIISSKQNGHWVTNCAISCSTSCAPENPPADSKLLLAIRTWWCWLRQRGGDFVRKTHGFGVW